MKVISTSELAQRIASDLNTPEEHAKAVLERAVAAMTKELRYGNSIDLDSFLSLKLRPGEATEVASTAGPKLGFPAGRTVQLELNADLRQEIESAQKFQILLAVQQKNFFTNVVAARLESERSEVTAVEGVSAAVEWLGNHVPQIVILDSGLEDGNQITQVVKTSGKTALSSVIQVEFEGVEDNEFSGLIVSCDETLKEPFELSDLVKTVESELARAAEERNYFDQVLQYKLHTEEELVEKANEMIGTLLANSGLNEEGSAALAVAFREAIDNAARHGNHSDPDNVISVNYLVDREKVTITVADEGDGFDTEMYLSRGVSNDPVETARERNRAGGAGGLGIMLMLKCVDKLEYKYSGNTIVLTKFLRPNRT